MCTYIPFYLMHTNEYQMYNYINFYNDGRINKLKQKTKKPKSFKADTHEGFCSRSMLQGHSPQAKLLRVYQRFHECTSSSGAEFPPRKILHDI